MERIVILSTTSPMEISIFKIKLLVSGFEDRGMSKGKGYP
jgi:hypothetical protein